MPKLNGMGRRVLLDKNYWTTYKVSVRANTRSTNLVSNHLAFRVPADWCHYAAKTTRDPI
jgi:hypothetical protein